MTQLYTRLSCIPSFDEGVLLRCEKRKSVVYVVVVVAMVVVVVVAVVM